MNVDHGAPRTTSYGLGPYRNGAGEVDFWRRELSLNDLGRSFMVVDDFAMRPSLQLTPKP